MRTFRQRVLLTLVATTVTAACGTAVGYLLGRAVTVKLYESRLTLVATRTIAEADASSLESRTALATMNATKYEFCSDAEIAWFRNLIFQSQYLKEAGRIQDGKVYCSATLGRLDRPIEVAAPDFSQSDGTRVYKGFTPFRMGDLKVVSLQLGPSYVVFNPYLQANREFPPMHYISTGIEDPSRQSSLAKVALPESKWSVLTTDSQTRVGENLYATRCSARYFNCVTDYISVRDALQAGQNYVLLFVALGGFTGACFGLVSSLLYRRNKSIEQQLRRAIRADAVRVVYQPIVDLASRRIVGAEVLARWADEDDIAVSPEIFIKIAEDRGFVGAITELVARHALREFDRTLRDRPDFRLSINVAAADLTDPEFLPLLDRLIQRALVPAESLGIEITESSTALHEVSIATIRRLRDRGYAVHIDDFGTGYSSLSYLRDLAVDAIKIDRSFTRAIGTEAVTMAILPQILAMAEALNLQVIVEGIETELQAEYFANCSQPILGQGWFFGRPVPVEEFQRLLAADEVHQAVF